MTVVLAWVLVGLVLGHGLDRVVRRAARAEARTPARERVPARAPGAGGPADGRGPDEPGADGRDADGLAADGLAADGDPDEAAGPAVPLDRHLHSARGALLVPALAAIGCLLVGLRYGGTAAGLPFLVFVPLLAELAVVDLHTHRLPNVLTLPALPAGLGLVAAVAVADGRPGVLVRALASAVLLFVVLLVLALLRPAGMGMGDVKAAAVIGLFVGSLGVGPATAAVVLASLAAFVGGLVLLAAGRIGARTATPFGPWLAVGALVAVLAGPELVAGYLDLVG